MENTTDLDHRFFETDCAVCVGENEAFLLWAYWFKGQNIMKSWKEDNVGVMCEVGNIDNCPIKMTVSWCTVDDVRVAFYQITSAASDTLQIEKWWKDNLPKVKHYSSGNFFHCIRDQKKEIY